MQFNNYLWGIYKKSKDYKKSCEYLENFKTIDTYLKYIKHRTSNENNNSIKKTYAFFANKYFNKNDAINIFTNWIKEGINTIERKDNCENPNNPLIWCSFISDWVLSDILYILHPDFFFVYQFRRDEFNRNFQTFVDVCELFEIALPKMPAKKDKLDRALYYTSICESLLEFRQRYNLTAVDMYAFIYDYAINILFDDTKCIGANDGEVLPAPTKAWFIVDRRYYNHQNMTKMIENIKSQEAFEVSKNAKEGDILMLYCPKPYYGLHSIWMLKKSSFIDPLFYNYRHGYICKPFIIPPIHLKEMKENTKVAKNLGVHVSFGTDIEFPVLFEEYNEILRILKDEKNFDISVLPKVELIESLDTNTILDDEKDVEEHLVEPFLKKIGYNSEKDYIRQMPLRMGTGVRYYPDYAFFANTQKGDEMAKCILETKYHILNDEQLENAFYQAKSYALRLNAYLLILCAREGIWIFQNDRKSNFSVKRYVHYTWNEISNTDNFHTIISLIGYKKMKKYKI